MGVCSARVSASHRDETLRRGVRVRALHSVALARVSGVPSMSRRARTSRLPSPREETLWPVSSFEALRVGPWARLYG
eukprot:13905067-Alexandrium_andersonii.AAC.1